MTTIDDLDPRLYFLPPYDGCYGCLGRGLILGVPCSCIEHEVGECEPDGGCSPECKRRRALRDEGPWTIEAHHPEALDVHVTDVWLTWQEANALATVFENAGCYASVWPTGSPEHEVARG